MAQNSFRIKNSLLLDPVAARPSNPSNGDVIYNSATGSFEFYANGSWTSYANQVTNFVVNGTADTATSSIFVPYQDSSGTRPVDGTGGTTTGITAAITTTNPLVGYASYTLTKDASNRQGGGWAVPFSVPLGYFSKACKISVDYIVNSGTFVAGSSTTESDVIWYLYDVTNSTLIEPSNIKMFTSSSTMSDTYRAEFQTSATGTGYRLIAHIQSTSASAYELKVDNISVSPSQYVYAAPITDWIDYTPTISANSGTLTNYTLSNTQYSRVGSNLYIKGKLTFTGAVGTWTFPVVGFPSGVNADTVNPTSVYSAKVTYNDFGTNNYGGEAQAFGTNGITLSAQRGTNGAGIAITQAAPFAWTTSDSIEWTVGPIKIAGWTSNTQQSDGYDAREVSFQLRAANASGINPNNSTVKLNPTGGTIVSDTVGGWRAGSGDYQIKTAGVYDFSATLNITITNVAASYHILFIFKNGIEIATGDNKYIAGTVYTGSSVTALGIPCNAGDVIDVRFSSSINQTVNTLSGALYFSLNKHQAPTTISATAVVAAQMTLAAATALTLNVAIPYSTKVYDTTGSTTTGAGAKWTAPRAGFATVRISQGSNTTVNYLLYKNGSSYAASPYIVSSSNTSGITNGTKKIPVIAGDYLQIVPDANTTLQVISDFEITLE